MKKEISPTQLARNERMRIAAEHGAIAMQEVRARDISVRKNMEKLRELRLEREANQPIIADEPVRKPRAKKALLRASA